MNKDKKEEQDKQEKGKEQDKFRESVVRDRESPYVPGVSRDKAHKEGEETTSTGPRATGENEKKSK